jgi:hypothetical protein
VFMLPVYLVGRECSVRHVAMHRSIKTWRRGSVFFATETQSGAGRHRYLIDWTAGVRIGSFARYAAAASGNMIGRLFIQQ